MSIHPTLRGVDTLKGERSVLTRTERLASLKKAGKFDADKRSVYGLPKVRTKFKVAGAKKKVKEAAPAAGGTVAASAVAPAAGGKGAAPAAAKAAPAGKKADKK
jgi:small basic protein (TIGR04137 family)